MVAMGFHCESIQNGGKSINMSIDTTQYVAGVDA